jgi:hypothetical protein
MGITTTQSQRGDASTPHVTRRVQRACACKSQNQGQGKGKDDCPSCGGRRA